MKKIILLLFIATAIFSLQSSVSAQGIKVVPMPQEVRYEGGEFDLNADISIQLYLNDKEEEAFLLGQIKDELDQSIGSQDYSSVDDSAQDIIIGIKGGSRTFNRLIREYDLEPGKELGDEGYRLLVNKKMILISANETEGAFYGVQTLKQLIRTQRIEGSIPGLKLKDWPDLEIRGMMDDISRGPVPTNAYFKQQIERMAELKINMLTYYTQDVVKTEKHPAFAPPGGALDIEEWAELADYARKYHIDLVGNFQSFGHFDQILKHPEYAHLGENGTLLSPAFEESYELLEDIYKEMIPAFHSDYFHINSDETFDLGSGASKAMVDSLGLYVVYANHIKRIHKIITGMGKKVMMWGDIALEHPEMLELLPKDIILITWGYDIMEDYAPRIEPFKEAGFKQLVSTGILNSYSTIPDFNVARGNIGGFMAETKKQGVWGMLNTVWDDGGFALFSKDWYGVAYAADQSWNSTFPNDESYDDRFNAAVYGSTNNGLSEALHTINDLAKLKSTEKMNEDVLWDQVIPDKGSETLMNIKDWPKVMEIADKAEQSLQQYDPLIYGEDVQFVQHTIDLYKYLAMSRTALVEASSSYKEAVAMDPVKYNSRRDKLVAAFTKVAKVTEALTDLKFTNQYLWTMENRVYALDRVISKYDDQLSALTEVKDSLLSEMYALDRGEKLAPASELRLDINESEGWYFQGWLMIEPIPYPAGAADAGIDHLEDMGGIGTTFPNVTEEFYYDGVKYRWKRVNTPYFAKVDLGELHGESENVAMYAFAHIDIPEDRTVRATIGSSDGAEVFVNGKSVFKNYTEREFEPDQDELFLPLHKGRNHLMIRITNHTGDWAFSFRVPDSEMRSYKNRYKIIE